MMTKTELQAEKATERRELVVNQKFLKTLRPLTFEERSLLKESIKKEGVRDAIVTWNGIIVDGHNRYEIATELGYSFKTVELNFESEVEVQAWIARTQKARRNLTTADLAKIGFELEKTEAIKAKDRMVEAHAHHDVSRDSISDLAGTARDIAAAQAGTSGLAIQKYKKIESTVPEILPILETNIITLQEAYGIANCKDPELQREKVIVLTDESKVAWIEWANDWYKEDEKRKEEERKQEIINQSIRNQKWIEEQLAGKEAEKRAYEAARQKAIEEVEADKIANRKAHESRVNEAVEAMKRMPLPEVLILGFSSGVVREAFEYIMNDSAQVVPGIKGTKK